MDSPDGPESPAPPSALEHLLDGAPAPASADALRAVVGRHRRWELRVLGPCLVTVLVAAAAGGFAIGRDNAATRSTTVSTTRAGSAASAPAGAASNFAAADGPGVSGGAVGTLTAPAPVPLPFSGVKPGETQVLVRTASDGTQVRLYKVAFPGGMLAAQCSSIAVDAQVSNRQVAGQQAFVQWTDGAAAAPSLALGGSGVIGAADPTPIAVVVVRTGPDVTQVSLTTASYGTDTTAPTDGLAVLALTLPADFQPGQIAPPSPQGFPTPPPFFPLGFPAATVTAHNRAGAAVGTLRLPDYAQGGPPPACVPKPTCFAYPPAPPTTAPPPVVTTAPGSSSYPGAPVPTTSPRVPVGVGACCGPVATKSSGAPPPAAAKGVSSSTDGSSVVAPIPGSPTGGVVKGCIAPLSGVTGQVAVSPPVTVRPAGAAPGATPGR